MTLDEKIEELQKTIIYLNKSIFELDNAAVVKAVLEDKVYRNRQLLAWLKDYKRLLNENDIGTGYPEIEEGPTVQGTEA